MPAMIIDFQLDVIGRSQGACTATAEGSPKARTAYLRTYAAICARLKG